MPKKDFTQVAFAVVQQATGEKPKKAPKTVKEAPGKASKPLAKTSVKKAAKDR